MNMEVTQSFLQFRECARNLWNTYFLPLQPEWEHRDSFNEALQPLFEGLVLKPNNIHSSGLACMSSSSPQKGNRFSPCPIIEAYSYSYTAGAF
jgi:hypothetical protein